MGLKLYPESAIQSIASAIRTRAGSNSLYTVSQMPTAIYSISMNDSNFWGTVTRNMSILSDSTITLISGFSTFCRWDRLISIYLPNCSYIGPAGNCGSVFYSCTNLTHVNLPSCTAISGSYVFYNCFKLSSVNLPVCTYIGSYTFNLCSALSSITLPACSYLQVGAFSKCYNLLVLSLPGSSICRLANKNAFTSTPISTYTTSTGGVRGSIFVPSSLLASYKAATNWVSYSSRFVGI